MFFVFPFRMDAPVDHRPWGTVGLVVANLAVAALLGFPGSGGAIDSWVLEFGTLNPLTWITSAFTHLDVGHVVFNVIFLWSFGLVVEGLIGWRRFLPLCFGIIAAEGALVQLLMLGAGHGGAAGASGLVFGLMSVAALWTPRNRMRVFLWFFILIRTLEVTVWGFCILFVGLEVLAALIGGLTMGSAVLHLIGAGLGVAAGLWMLKQGFVDTGGWDYLSLRAHGRPRRGVVAAPASPGPEAPVKRDPRAAALVRVRDALEEGRALDADDGYDEARRALPGFTLPRADLEALIQGLRAGGQAERAIRRLEEHLRSHADPTGGVRLALAEQLLLHRRPGSAVEHLAALAGVALSPERRAAAAEIERRARALLDERGGLELE